MAKGYPTPKPPAEGEWPRLVPEGVCIICKKRDVAPGSEDYCAECKARLGR